MLPLELFLCLFGGGSSDLINKNCKGINYTFASSSLAHPPGTGYICGSVDVFILAAKGEGSPTCSRFAGAPTGTESKKYPCPQ